MEINLRKQLVAFNLAVDKTKILRDNLIKYKSSQRRFHDAALYCSVRHRLSNTHLDPRMQRQRVILICKDCFIYILKELSFAHRPRSLLRQIVDAKHHILRRNRNRAAVRRFQQVIRRQQKETALRLRFHRKRKMNRHLVAVKVRVVSCTYQWMKFDRLTFYKHRLKCLDPKPMQRRGAVQHNRMLFYHILQHIPNLRLQPLNHLLCILNVVGCSVLNQFFHNKWLKQLDRHLLWKTALINLKLRSHHDNGTAGIVHTFAQQVLTETAGFTLQHIRQGLQSPIARPGYRTAPAAVINQRVNSLLKHPLFIPHNNIRRSQFQKPL